MSTFGFCGLPGHNVRTCPIARDNKKPWLKDPGERWHTKITDYDQEVPCNCQYWDEGETHYDFDGM